MVQLFTCLDLSNLWLIYFVFFLFTYKMKFASFSSFQSGSGGGKRYKIYFCELHVPNYLVIRESMADKLSWNETGILRNYFNNFFLLSYWVLTVRVSRGSEVGKVFSSERWVEKVFVRKLPSTEFVQVKFQIFPCEMKNVPLKFLYLS